MSRIGDRYESGELTKSEYNVRIQECQRELKALNTSRQEVDIAIQREYEWQSESLKTMQSMLDNIDGTTAKVWASFQLFTSDDIRQFLSDFQIQVIVLIDHVEIKGLIPKDEVRAECKQIIGSGS